LHWIGVSFGLTADLFRFWKRAHFNPVYLRQTTNDLTGEHTCIMMRAITNGALQCDPAWLSAFAADFKKRFVQLLAFQFKEFAPALALNVMDIKLLEQASNEEGMHTYFSVQVIRFYLN
jgi:N-acetyltransferase 10